MKKMTKHLSREDRLEMICTTIRYCKQVKNLGMPASCYGKALREPIHFLWELRTGNTKDDTVMRKSIEAATFETIMGRGSGNLIYDHAIPFRLQQERLLNLSDQEITHEFVEGILLQYEGAVLITKNEESKLNKLGLGRSMPAGWEAGGSKLARYDAASIVLLPSSPL